MLKTVFRGVQTVQLGLLAAAFAASTLGLSPAAEASPLWCTTDFPVAPANARCVNYSSTSFAGGYCWLNQPAYTADGRAIPSSCDYYDNAPSGVGRPPLPQIVPPASAPSGVSVDATLLCQRLDAEPTTARLNAALREIFPADPEADKTPTLSSAFKDRCPQYAPLYGLLQKIWNVPDAMAEIGLRGNLSATPIHEWTEPQRRYYEPNW